MRMLEKDLPRPFDMRSPALKMKHRELKRMAKLARAVEMPASGPAAPVALVEKAIEEELNAHLERIEAAEARGEPRAIIAAVAHEHGVTIAEILG